VQVSGLGTSVIAVAGGHTHTCAVTSAGSVKCWGDNEAGQLGDGTTTDRTAPVDVAGASSASAVAAGTGHSCAVTRVGGVQCWGFTNIPGSLGDGSGIGRPAAVDVVGLDSVTALAAGSGHTCALTRSGGVKCWGANYYGQLGDGTLTSRRTPVEVTGLDTGVVALAAGWAHTCAVTAAGGLKCWGGNHFGQLGDGTTTNRVTPVDASGFSGRVIAVATGPIATCALVTGGELRCWAQEAELRTPAGFPTLGRDANALAAGASHTCALTASGRLKCWGDNIIGALGDGTTTRRLAPVDVIGFGPPPKCRVPNVNRQTFAAAKVALKRANCALGTVTRAYSATIRQGRVISQRPGAGSTRPYGSAVNLVISKGKRT
jgi:alpha-tubulin suppressor-like RCC1 family protein